MTREQHLSEFTESYIATLLWSETDYHGRPLDERYDAYDIDFGSMCLIEDQCRQFMDKAREVGIAASQMRMAGHDFCMSRNGHGAGFFDGDWGGQGKELHQLAASMGEQHLHISDEGLFTEGA